MSECHIGTQQNTGQRKCGVRTHRLRPIVAIRLTTAAFSRHREAVSVRTSSSSSSGASDRIDCCSGATPTMYAESCRHSDCQDRQVSKSILLWPKKDMATL